MREDNLDFKLMDNYAADRIDVYLFTRSVGQAVWLAGPLQFHSIDPTKRLAEDQRTFHVNRAEAQVLMDRLWSLGIRPTEKPDPKPESSNETRTLWDHIGSLKNEVRDKHEYIRKLLEQIQCGK